MCRIADLPGMHAVGLGCARSCRTICELFCASVVVVSSFKLGSIPELQARQPTLSRLETDMVASSRYGLRTESDTLSPILGKGASENRYEPPNESLELNDCFTIGNPPDCVPTIG